MWQGRGGECEGSGKVRGVNLHRQQQRQHPPPGWSARRRGGRDVSRGAPHPQRSTPSPYSRCSSPLHCTGVAAARVAKALHSPAAVHNQIVHNRRRPRAASSILRRRVRLARVIPPSGLHQPGLGWSCLEGLAVPRRQEGGWGGQQAATGGEGGRQAARCTWSRETGWRRAPPGGRGVAVCRVVGKRNWKGGLRTTKEGRRGWG